MPRISAHSHTAVYRPHGQSASSRDREQLRRDLPSELDRVGDRLVGRYEVAQEWRERSDHVRHPPALQHHGDRVLRPDGAVTVEVTLEDEYTFGPRRRPVTVSSHAPYGPIAILSPTVI